MSTEAFEKLWNDLDDLFKSIVYSFLTKFDNLIEHLFKTQILDDDQKLQIIMLWATKSLRLVMQQDRDQFEERLSVILNAIDDRFSVGIINKKDIDNLTC